MHDAPIRCDHHNWAEALNADRTGVAHGVLVCVDCRTTTPVSAIKSVGRCPVIKYEDRRSGWTPIADGDQT